MPLLGAQDLTKAYGERAILDGVSLAIKAGQRLGLVGSNGCGKTTLARVLAGIEAPDAGQVTRRRGTSMAYLDQEPRMEPDATALAVVRSGLAAWTEAMRAHETASAALGDGDRDEQAWLASQAEAAAAIERLGGWHMDHEAETLLGHLGVIAPERAVGTMSGGERRRVALARLLVSRPDVAILDEPTNHLDIPTIEWLEQFLVQRFTGALVLITHDRYLLDRVVQRTLELDGGVLYGYDGGWEAYLAGNAERVAQGERAEANRQNFLRRELEWLRRQPKARTGKQKARIARAHAAINTDGPQRRRDAQFAVGKVRSGKTVLEAEDLAVEIGGARVVEALTLRLDKGERIGIVGPNGVGKTTLIGALLGDRPPAAGTVVIGKNTRVAYLDQLRSGLDDRASIFDNVAEGRSQVTLGTESMDVQSYLKRMLFEPPAQRRLVGTLSGGERARVALARALRESANLVVLDEPTNDLDVATLGALEASLLDFGGTALVVTHDRWFLDRVATSILAFEGDGHLVHVQGGFADYVAWRERERERTESAGPRDAPRDAPPKAASAHGPAPKRRAGLTYAERLELSDLMDRIAAAEDEVATLEATLETPAFAQRDYTEQATFLATLAEARAAAEALVERWSELEERNAAG